MGPSMQRPTRWTFEVEQAAAWLESEQPAIREEAEEVGRTDLP